jgi:4-hydroxybenzoate polyprenyltransferase
MTIARSSTPLQSLPHRLTLVARDIKLTHSVFALPFALLAMYLAAASVGRSPAAIEFALIVLCMVLARTVAMTVNRWADATFDAANPRTDRRALPSGKLTGQFMLGTAIACGLTFIVATSGFWLLHNNVLPMLLSPVVLAYLALYSFTKRFTWLCHIILGSTLALSPLAAVVAIEPGYLGEPTAYLLALMVLCWVAGFDVIYALQDIDIDKNVGLFSMPAHLGADSALWVSRLLHAAAAAALIAVCLVSSHLNFYFAIASALTIALLAFEHALVYGSKTHHIHIAFFTVNGLISLLLGAAGIVDVVLSR